MSGTDATAISGLVARSRFEVLPLDGVEERVLAHVPKGVTLTVTASPTKGLTPTLELCAVLAGHGYAVVPHLSARLVTGREHLAEVVAQLDEIGVRDVFVVGGDAPEPVGPYASAGALLDDLDELGHPFTAIGITGYPEPHPLVDDATMAAAMTDKARHATYIATQVCFDPSLTARWIEGVRSSGLGLPVLVGVPGVVSRAKLMRISTKIGIGDSLRFLRKHGSFATRFLRGGFSPTPLVEGLGPELARGTVQGFHVFTFNDLEDTMAWRARQLNGAA